MSLLPPVSVNTSATSQPRDPAALALATAQRAAPAVSATLTQTAVQQAKAGTRADLLTTRDLVPVADKRSRLVGPPPTFDVNVLQHIRETRNDPPEMALSGNPAESATPNGTDGSETDMATVKADRKTAAIGHTYEQLHPKDPPADDADTVDARY